MYFILSFADVNLGFTVANISLPINKVFIAYDDDINYTIKHQCVCKIVLATMKPAGKITRVKINDLFQM
jgi:hypothetical protein